MTDSEIRKRAEEFAKKMEEQLETGIYDCEEDLKIEESYNEGYINGLEEGYYQAMKDCYSAWHDLNIERIHITHHRFNHYIQKDLLKIIL